MLHLSGLPGLIAVVLYGAAAMLALRAWSVTRGQSGLRHVPDWHGKVWLFAAALFAVCAVSRLLGIEEGWRNALRNELQVERIYAVRREYQAVLASAIIVLVALAAVGASWLARRHGLTRQRGFARDAAWAGVACGTMIVLIALRMVSLHMLDSLLYRGPRLNWVLDIGSTVAVIALAWRYPADLGKAMARARHSKRAGANELIDR